MKKSIIIISVVVAILLIALIVFLIIKNNSTVVDTGTRPLDSREVLVSGETKDGTTQNNPNGYTELDKGNITGTDDIVVESVAYNYDSGEGVTHVNVHIQNKGAEPLNHDSVVVVELYDSNNEFLYRFGGVIESDNDIPVGERSVIKTQFIDKPGDIASAKVSLDRTNEATISE